MSSNQHYTYDPETCTFVEVEVSWQERAKKIGMVVAAGLLIALAGAWAMDAQVIATPEEQALKSENEVLREQLQRAGTQMTALSSELDRLASRDKELYRTLLQIEPISEDVRQVGVGGTDPYEQYDRFSDDTANLLASTAETLDKLERQVSLQGASYRELARVAETRDERLGSLPAIRPANGRIVSGYGMRHHPILKVRKMHAGTDFLLRTGTPVMSTADGIVRRATYSPTYGNYVDIYHKASGYMTRYAHLSEFAEGIRRGVTVKRGQQIAFSGNTGRSTGPHLHYEVRELDSKRTLNPMNFFVPDMTPSAFHELERRTEVYESRVTGEDIPMDAHPDE